MQSVYTQALEETKPIKQNEQLRPLSLPKAYFIFKRVLDIVVSAAALVFFLPLMLVVALAIKLDSKGPAIFKQKRVGQNGKIFMMYKFRSMADDAEEQKKFLRHKNEKGNVIFKIKKDPRITRVGRFIRKTSIDELPQLFNILKSDMTIVGPRPPLPDEVEKYTNYQKQRLSIKGGLTCYWQISGRSNISFEEWVELDLKYIREMRFWTDIKIVFKTFKAVLSCNGAE